MCIWTILTMHFARYQCKLHEICKYCTSTLYNNYNLHAIKWSYGLETTNENAGKMKLIIKMNAGIMLLTHIQTKNC